MGERVVDNRARVRTDDHRETSAGGGEFRSVTTDAPRPSGRGGRSYPDGSGQGAESPRGRAAHAARGVVGSAGERRLWVRRGGDRHRRKVGNKDNRIAWGSAVTLRDTGRRAGRCRRRWRARAVKMASALRAGIRRGVDMRMSSRLTPSGMPRKSWKRSASRILTCVDARRRARSS